MGGGARWKLGGGGGGVGQLMGAGLRRLYDRGFKLTGGGGEGG